MSSDGRRIRFYTLTKGRAAREVDLPLDQMMVRTDTQGGHVVRGDHAKLYAAMDQPQTLADLSGALGHPVGVVRVMCLDLIQAGTLVIADAGRDATVPAYHDLDLLNEVLERIAHL